MVNKPQKLLEVPHPLQARWLTTAKTLTLEETCVAQWNVKWADDDDETYYSEITIHQSTAVIHVNTFSHQNDYIVCNKRLEKQMCTNVILNAVACSVTLEKYCDYFFYIG